MKKWVVFLLGLISGFVLSVFTFAFVGLGNENQSDFFEEPGECLSTNNFQIMHVVDNGSALAYEVVWNSLIHKYVKTDLLVLLVNDNDEYYYDNQIIKIPKGKCARQVGIYKYYTKVEIEKTVPIVKIME